MVADSVGVAGVKLVTIARENRIASASVEGVTEAACDITWCLAHVSSRYR
jgi:hypothetical protein